MLHFFRKYQKFFFLFTTVVIISSFAFFGTFQVMTPPHNPMKEPAFVDYKGKKISRSLLEKMIYFISFSGDENLFNEGIVENLFIKGGLADELFLANREKWHDSLASQLSKEKSFIPYEHPTVSTLSATSIWKTLAPAIPTHLSALQNARDPLSLDTFREREKLYLAEKGFPGRVLKQCIFYKSREYEDCPPDFRLYNSDLNLFGYKNITDWFGRELVEEMAKLIFNIASFAEKKGFTVTKEEAAADLFFKVHKAIEKQKMGKSLFTNIDQAEVRNLYNQVMQAIQLPEEDLVAISQKILLVERFFDGIENGAFVDTQAIHEFFTFASEYATIDLYKLPPSFCFSTEMQWQEFETYLDLACKRENQGHIPESLNDLAEIEAQAPELIKQKLTLLMATFEKKDLEAKIGMKQLWDWEIESQNWAVLKERFPQLLSGNDKTRTERHELLEKMDEKAKASLDAFAREKIVEAHPEWIKEALEKAECVKRTFYFGCDFKKSPIEGIDDIGALLDVLEKNDSQKLSCYTQDKKTYFKIESGEKGEKSLFTFVEASKEGILTDLLEKKLRTHYLNLRQTSPGKFKNAEGEWKSFSEVKTVVAKDLFKPLEETLQRFKDKGIEKSRFIPYLEAKKEQIMALADEQRELPVEWKIEKKTLTITRSNPTVPTYEEVAGLKEGDISEILFSYKLGPYFYRVVQKKKDVTLPLTSYLKARESLGKETKAHFLRSFLANEI